VKLPNQFHNKELDFSQLEDKPNVVYPTVQETQSLLPHAAVE